MKSEAFQRGYDRAVTDWKVAQERGMECEFRNPFEVGSEEDMGYETACYDLTQK